MLITRPQRALSMSSSARRVQWKAPLRLTSTTRSHSSADMRIARPSSRPPALLTSTSTGPKRSRTASKAAATCSESETSALTSEPLPLRDSVATFQPPSRRRCAIAAPIPREPPVTSAQPPSGADMHALLPADDARAPDEAGAERRQRDDPAGLQAPVALGVGQREWDRRRRGVRDLVDVDHELL